VPYKDVCRRAIRRTWAGMVICLVSIIFVGFVTRTVAVRERAERAAAAANAR